MIVCSCILVTLFIAVRKVARSRDFYARVLGGTVVLDENPCMVATPTAGVTGSIREFMPTPHSREFSAHPGCHYLFPGPNHHVVAGRSLCWRAGILLLAHNQWIKLGILQ
jgi:catechol 2,3-dioxygenase-like lactoylglutathione lyase family enzyme